MVSLVYEDGGLELYMFFGSSTSVATAVWCGDWLTFRSWVVRAIGTIPAVFCLVLPSAGGVLWPRVACIGDLTILSFCFLPFVFFQFSALSFVMSVS